MNRSKCRLGRAQMAALCLVFVSMASRATLAESELRELYQTFAAVTAPTLLPDALGSTPARQQRVMELRGLWQQSFQRLGEQWITQDLAADKAGMKDTPDDFANRAAVRTVEALARAGAAVDIEYKLALLEHYASMDAKAVCLKPGSSLTKRLPQTDRYFDGVEHLLRHLGVPGQGVPPVPEPPFLERVISAGWEASAAPAAAPVPLSMELQRYLKTFESTHVPTNDWDTRFCELSIWWSKTVLLKSAAERDEDVRAFSYYLQTWIAERAGQAFFAERSETDGLAPSDYPAAASAFNITGATTVAVLVDDGGIPRHAYIVGRKLKVPGVEGEHSAAFEHIFDDVAISNARSRTYAGREPGEPEAGLHLRKIDLRWTLK